MHLFIHQCSSIFFNILLVKLHFVHINGATRGSTHINTYRLIIFARIGTLRFRNRLQTGLKKKNYLLLNISFKIIKYFNRDINVRWCYKTVRIGYFCIFLVLYNWKRENTVNCWTKYRMNRSMNCLWFLKMLVFLLICLPMQTCIIFWYHLTQVAYISWTIRFENLLILLVSLNKHHTIS